MSNKSCCIISETLKKNNPRLKKAFDRHPLDKCQFHNISSATYEYEGNYYCLLHLPCKAAKKNELKAEIIAALNKYISNNQNVFNYICIDQVKINLTIGAKYSFVGAQLLNVELSGSYPESVNFAYSKIENLTVTSLYTARFEMRECLIISNFHFVNSKTNCLFAGWNTIILKDKKTEFNDLNFKFYLNGDIETIILVHNKFYIPLRVEAKDIKELKFPRNTFFSCPIIFQENIKNIPILSLPQKKAFSFTKYPKSCISKKMEEYLGEGAWADQYKKFREIYNIAKMRNMYTEQSDYFSLMQYCLRKSKQQPFLLRLFSSLYQIVSDYGQSVLRPLLVLFFSFFIFGGIFSLLGVKRSDAFYLSLTQIIKPYSLLYDSDTRIIMQNYNSIKNNELIYNLDKPAEKNSSQQNSFLLADMQKGWFFIISSIMESTTSIVLLTCFILALRWNFRKA